MNNLYKIAVLLLLLNQTALAQRYPQSTYHYDPRAVYTRPPRREATYRSAKDYWKEKRKALSQGKRKFRSASELANENLIKSNQNPKTKKQTTKKATNEEAAPAGAPGAIYSVGAAPSSTSTTGVTVSSPDKDPGVPKATMTYSDFERSSCKRLLRSLNGAPFNESGFTPKEGFSPAGLVHYIFTRIGHRVPKGTPEDLWNSFGVHMGKSYANFSPGDILFFRLFSKSEQKGKLFVAITLDGEYMVYPSFTRKKVVTRTYRDRFWRKRFVGAKRAFIE